MNVPERDHQFNEVNAVLDVARPALELHGGGIQLADVTNDGIVKVILKGHCVGCAISTVTMKLGIERLLKERLPHIVHAVEEV